MFLRRELSRTRVSLFLSGILSTSLFFVPVSHAADWTTSYANLTRVSYLASEAVSPPFALLWQYENPKPLKGASLVAVDRVFLSDAQFHVWSLKLPDGSVVWKHEEARDPREVKCYNALTGELRWTQRVDGKIIHTPQVGQRIVFVGTSAGTLYAFNQQDGKELWKVSLATPLTLAAADASLVVVGSGSTLVGLKVTDGSQAFVAELGGPISSHPVLSTDGAYVSVGDSVVALNRAGQKRWKAELAKPVSTPLAVTKAGVLVGCVDGVVQVLSLASGSVVWEELLAGIPSTVSGAGDVVYVGTRQSTLVGLRLSDGAKLWSAALEHGPVDGVTVSAGKLLVTAGTWVGALLPAPAAPENVAVTSEGGRASLVWDASAANGSTISAYRIFRRRGASVSQVAVVAAQMREFTQAILPGEIGYQVSAIAANGSESIRSVEIILAKGEPLIRRLAVSPVPLDPRVESLRVSFELREGAQVFWMVVDTEGQALIDERVALLSPGPATLSWNGVDRMGQQVEPGVYRVQITAVAAEEEEELARAFSVQWTFDSVGSGLAGGTAGGGSGIIGAAGSVVSAGPGESVASTSGGAVSDGVTDGGKGNKGVRDHGVGQGRNGAGQGKGQGKKK